MAWHVKNPLRGLLPIPASSTSIRGKSGVWSWKNLCIVLACGAFLPFLLVRQHPPPGRGFYDYFPRPFSGTQSTSEACAMPITAHSPLSIPELRDIVAKTQGYYVRDWSLHLGWNNMRYIMESAINHAGILNRTLVLPTYVYARNCELEPAACSAFGEEVERSRWGVTEDLPAGERSSWRMPLEVMLDIGVLRSRHSVLLMSEYLALHNLSTTLEHVNGHWDAELYQSPRDLFHISPWDYDGDMVRLDHMPPARSQYTRVNDSLTNELESAVYQGRFIDYLRAKEIVAQGSRYISEEDVEEILINHGYEIVYTYGGNQVEHQKFVGEPILFVVVRDRMRGYADDYKEVPHKVIWLQGEVHVNRRPGDLLFSTTQARDEYSRLVLYTMRRPINVLRIAERIDMRMRERVGNRMWMAGHMRRGDFATVWWTHVAPLREHFAHIKEGIMRGRKVLQRLYDTYDFLVYDIPDVLPYIGFFGHEPPQAGDGFFLATDERNDTERAWMRSQGAIFIDDLLTRQDRRELGWSVMMTDFLGVLDQAILSRAAFFHGRADSSVSGGALNMRAALGMDPRTAQVDE